MAVFNSFTFDGINSLDYGIYITGEAVYNAPERVVEMVTVPGRNGSIAIDQGRFENIEVTYPAGCFADSQTDFADKVMRFRNALASRYTYKRLTDEYHSDEYRLGLYKSGLDVEAVRYGTAGQFDITFDCKPQRFLTSGETAVTPSDYGNPQTETGELVTIESDGSLGVKSLEVELEPIQSLNGYDAPWVGGAGKNKLSNNYYEKSVTSRNGITYTVNDDGSVTLQGTSTVQGVSNWEMILSGSPSGLKAGTYIISADGLQNGVQIVFGGNVSSIPCNTVTYQNTSRQFTLSSDDATMGYCLIQVNGGATINTTIFPMIRLATETDATFAPYENICPISGRTEVVTQRTGKNLLRLPTYEEAIAVTDIVATYYSIPIRVKPSTSYYLQTEFTNGYTAVGKGLYVLVSNDPNGNSAWKAIAHNTADGGKLDGAMVSTSEGYLYLRIMRSLFNRSAWETLLDNVETMLSVGTTATDYEPYNGTTHTTDLERTVYGGTLDVVSGELTVDRVMFTLNTANLNGSNVYPGWNHVNGLREAVGIGINGKVNSITSFTSTLVSANTRGSNSVLFFGASELGMTADELAEALPNTDLQLCVELAQPQTYQLTPSEIALLKGQNNVWCDGEITVEYGVHPYYNPTQFESRPLLVVTGKGVLQIGDYVLTIVGRDNQTIYIDCESQEAWEVVGAGRVSRNDYIQNAGEEFPVLVPGINNISVGSGITAVTITPRWWRI